MTNIRGSGLMVPLFQLIFELKSRKKGNPKTALSCPKSVIKKSTVRVSFPKVTWSCALCVMLPALLRVPSML